MSVSRKGIYNVLVVGIGNLLMSDDGLGVHAARKMEKMKLLPGVFVLEAGTAVISYLHEISSSKNLIIVDTIRAGGKPGSVYRLSLDELTSQPDSRYDSHGYSILDVISLARAVNGFPQKVIICGMEPKYCGWGVGLTKGVRQNLPELIKEINSIIGTIK